MGEDAAAKSKSESLCGAGLNAKGLKRAVRLRWGTIVFGIKAGLILAVVGVILYAGFRGGEVVGKALSRQPPPPPMPSSAKASSSQRTSVFEDDDPEEEEEDTLGVPRGARERLAAFYKKHNPSRLADIDVILSRYRGREESLFTALAAKYNTDDADADADDVNDDSEDDDNNDFEPAADERADIVESVRADSNSAAARISAHRQIGQLERPDQSERIQVDVAALGDSSGSFSADDGAQVALPTGDLDVLFDATLEGDEAPMAPDPAIEKSPIVILGMPGTGIAPLARVLGKPPFGLSRIVNPLDSARLYTVTVDGSAASSASFDVYGDVDVIVGLGPSLFWEEILATYPSAKVIITVRHVDAWYEAWSPPKPHDCKKQRGPLQVACERHESFVTRGLKMLLGSSIKEEYRWKQRYYQWYERVLESVPASRRVLVDLFSQSASASAWKWLDRFVSGGSTGSAAALKALPSLPLGEGEGDRDGAATPRMRRGIAVPPGRLSSLHRAFAATMQFLHRPNGRLKIAIVSCDAAAADVTRTAARLRKFSARVASAKNADRALSGERPNFGAGGAFDKYDAAALVGSTAFALPGILAANPNAATVFIIPRRSSSSSYVQAMQCRRLQRAVVVAAGSSREKTTMRIVDLNAASDAKAFRSSSFWKHLL